VSEGDGFVIVFVVVNALPAGPRDVMDRADRAMGRAKTAGRNGVIVAEKDRGPSRIRLDELVRL
jgi:PleD family two-component response regulator